MQTEPELQPLTGEQLNRGTIKGDEARLDVRARGFWGRGQNAYFDVRVTNANSESVKTTSVGNVLSKHEREEKKRAYNERIMNVKQGTFTPLILQYTEGMVLSAWHFTNT